MYKSELNKDSSYSCRTCDIYDDCELHIKNTGASLYCGKFKLKYGCEWFYRKSKSEEEKE
jgi:hypothetical protein